MRSTYQQQRFHISVPEKEPVLSPTNIASTVEYIALRDEVTGQ